MNQSTDDQPVAVDSFTLVLHKTYFNSGFFNVPVPPTDPTDARDGCGTFCD